MTVRPDQFFPTWLTSNFVFLPPIIFFLSLMFAFGLFFQIDHRLMLILSFADYLLYFTLFSSITVVLVVSLSGFVMWLDIDWVSFFQRHQKKLQYLMILFIMLGSFQLFIGPLAGSLVGLAAGLLVIATFIGPATLSYEEGDVRRFRFSVLFLIFGLSWFLQAAGQLSGASIISGPKRVYQIKLADSRIVYANILFYTSNGIIYRTNGAVHFSPNGAVIFTKRTAERSAL